MVIAQGEVWWADLPAPGGSGPVCVPLTSNLKWADAPGNVSLAARLTGLPKDSVANVSQIVAVDRQFLTERVGKLPRAKLELLFSGIDIVLGK